MVMAVLRALKMQMAADGSLSAVDMKFGGPVPSTSQFDEFDDGSLAEAVEYYDNISGEVLPVELVQKARAEEIGWVRGIGLYDKVPRSVAVARGIKPLPVRWVDVNKGDRTNYNVRSRLVGKELKAKTKEALLAHELFSATPPWEVIKTLLSLLVTDGVPGVSDGELELGVFDISRAHFMPKVNRELYVEIPEEDRSPEDGDVVGKLNRNMYGFRDASSGWMRDWQELLQTGGYEVGVANPALFYNRSNGGRGAVHGDDFYVLGSRKAIDEMSELLSSKYSMRESHRLGFGEHCDKSATILNRVVSVGVEDGRRFVQVEPDQRHVEIILEALGLKKEKTKGVVTPSAKLSEAEWDRRRLSPPLSPSRTTSYRSCVMRASFLGQDRPDIAETVKTLAQGMASPRESHWEDLKRLGRYLLQEPTMALRYDQQTMSKTVRISVDSDHASDRSTRKSTTGMVIRVGQHVVKATSNLQTAVSLNVSEAEFYALVHGGAHGLGFQAFMKDLDLEFDIVIESDSSSARAFASRKGLGRQRHVQTRFLWLQEAVAGKMLVVTRVPTDRNVSDILTKCCGASTLAKHLATMKCIRVVAHKMHKSVATT